MSSLLPVVDICDNFKAKDSANFTSFVLGSAVLGVLTDPVVDALCEDNELRRRMGRPGVWDLRHIHNASRRSATFNSWLDTPEQRTQAVRELTERWRDSGMFPSQVAPSLWRDEEYCVYYNPLGPIANSAVAFSIERAACALFGVVTYSVHLTLYTPDHRIWVAARSKTKATWPGYLDNTAGGGVSKGFSPTEALIKECCEEANLSEELVRQNLEFCGHISYFHQKRDGWFRPCIQFVYELCLPAIEGNLPKPYDGEVESFELHNPEAVAYKLKQKLFKPDSALVLIDFLIRHGHVTEEDEENYSEITTRLHRVDFADRIGVKPWSYRQRCR